MNGSHTLRSQTKGGKKMASAEQLKFELLAVDRASRPIQQVQGRVRNFDRQIKQSSVQMNQFGGSLTGATKNLRKFALGGVQQAGYQIGDYAVQVANGTSATQAFGQQAGQFFQIFGPFGAVLGAAISVFSAFKMAADKAAGATNNVETAVTQLSAAYDTLDSIDFAGLGDELSAPATAAMAKYSDLLALIRRVAEEQRDQALKTVLGALPPELVSSQQDMLKRIQTDVGNNVKLTEAQQSIYKSLLAITQKRARAEEILLGINGSTRQEAAESLQNAISTLDAEQLLTPELDKQLKLFAEQQGLIGVISQEASATKDEASKTSDAYRDILGSTYGLIQAEEAIKQLYIEKNGAIDKTAANYVDILGSENGLAQAVEAANQLYKNRLGTIDTTANDYVDILGSEKGLSAAIAANNKLYADRLAAKQSEIAAARASFMIEASVTVAETERAKAIKEMQEAYAKITGGDKGSESIKNTAEIMKTELSPELMRIKDASEMVGSSFESAIMSMVDGTMTAKDAFRTMARDIISELYRIFVVKQITGFITGAVSGAFAPASAAGTGGSVAPPRAPRRAMGGPMSGGQAYMVGERGPELVIPSRNSHVVPNNQMGGGVVVQQTFNFAANGDESVKQIIAQQAPKIAKMTQQSIMESRRRGGQMKAVFG